MRGLVLGFDSSIGTGLLRGDDGRRYVFAIDDWLAKPKPRPGQVVDFELHKGMALEIYVIKNASPLDRVVLGDTLTFLSRRISSFSKQYSLSEKLILPLLLVILFAFPFFAHEARDFSGYNVIGYVRHMLATTGTLSAIGSTETREVMQAAREALYLYLFLYALPFWAAYKLMRGLQGYDVKRSLFGLSLSMVLVPLLLPLMSLFWFYIMAPSGNASLKRSVVSNLYLSVPEAYLNYSWGAVMLIGLGGLGLLDALRKGRKKKVVKAAEMDTQPQAVPVSSVSEALAAEVAPEPEVTRPLPPQTLPPQPQQPRQPRPQPHQAPQQVPQEAPQQYRPPQSKQMPQQPVQQSAAAPQAQAQPKPRPRPQPPVAQPAPQQASEASAMPSQSAPAAPSGRDMQNQPRGANPTPQRPPEDAYSLLDTPTSDPQDQEGGIFAEDDDISELLKRIREEEDGVR